MKRLLLLLLMAGVLRAADTTVTGFIGTGQSINGVRVPAQGSVVFTPVGHFFAANGDSVDVVSTTVQIPSNGVISVDLVPTTNSPSGGAAYQARYFLTNGRTRTDILAVPVSITPVTLQSVTVATIPGPAYGQIPLTQLSGSGAVSGNCVVYINGTNSWLPCATGGAVYAVFTSQSTWSFPGSSHGQGCGVIPQIYDTGGNEMPFVAVFRDPSLCDITASFGAPTSGLMVVTGQGSGNYLGQTVCTLPCTITKTQHKFATVALQTAFYDTFGNLQHPAVFRDPTTLAVTFSGAGTGYPVIGGLSGGSSGGGGTITLTGDVAGGGTSTVGTIVTGINGVALSGLGTGIYTFTAGSPALAIPGTDYATPTQVAAALQKTSNLSDLTSAPTARANLGLGNIATHSITDTLQSANNLSDLGSASTARTNLGLQSAATQPSTAFATAPALQGSIQALYRFDEGSGTSVIDYSGNGYNMTISGGCTAWSNEGLVSTTNTGTCVSVPAAALNGAYAIQAWVRPSAVQFSTLQYYGYIIGGDAHPDGLLVNEIGHVQLQSNGVLTSDSGDGVAGFHSVTAVVGSPTTFYVDGKVIQSTALPTNTTQFGTYTTVRLFSPGTYGYPFGFTGTIMGLAIYSAAPTQAQVVANDQYMLSQKFAPRGLTSFDPEILPQIPTITFQGDSICSFSSAAGGSPLTWFPQAATSMTGQGWQFFNTCVGGQLLQTEATAYASQVHQILSRVPAPLKVNFLEGGVNDTGISTAAQMLGYAQSICSAAHTDGAKAIVSTIPPASTRNNTTLATYSASLISGWLAGTLGCDAVADFAGDPVLGLAALDTDTTWRFDGLHWNQMGHTVESYRAALAIHMVSRPGVSFTLPVPVSYKVPLQTAATTATVNLLQLGPDWVVDNVALDVGNSNVCPAGSVAYAGSGISTVTASVGDSTGSSTQYMSAQSLTSTGRIAYSQNTFNSNKGIVQANFTSSAGNLSALASGCATFYITVHRIP